MTRTRKLLIASAALFTPAVAWAATSPEAAGLCGSLCSLLGCCG